MKRLASQAALASACALIVVTNIALLSTAAWNRRGEPEAELTLTERELALPAARQDEGSGLELSLVLTHRAPGMVRRTARWKRHELPPFDYGWLDRTKLRELGFRIDLDPSEPDAPEHYEHAMARRAYLVVEYDGAAWKRWLADREKQLRELRRRVEEGAALPGDLADARAMLALDRTMRSRLFPVDAGMDADALRRRYPDRRRFAVVAALLRPKVVQAEGGEPFMSGQIDNPVVRRVHVPRNLRRHLESFLPHETWEEIEERERRVGEAGWPSPVPPRYQASMALGRRHEPWLVSVAALESDAAVRIP